MSAAVETNSPIQTQSSSASIGSTNSTPTPPSLKPTLLGVLRNQLQAPYSLDAFRSYLVKELSVEMLEFVLEVWSLREKMGLSGQPPTPTQATGNNYTTATPNTLASTPNSLKRSMSPINGVGATSAISTQSSHSATDVISTAGSVQTAGAQQVSSSPEPLPVPQCVEAVSRLIQTYVRVPSKKELSLPDKVRNNAINAINNMKPDDPTLTHKDIDALLKPIENAVMETLRNDKFPRWIKEISSAQSGKK